MWIEVPDAYYLGKEFQNTTFINLNDLCKIRVDRYDEGTNLAYIEIKGYYSDGRELLLWNDVSMEEGELYIKSIKKALKKSGLISTEEPDEYYLDKKLQKTTFINLNDLRIKLDDLSKIRVVQDEAPGNSYIEIKWYYSDGRELTLWNDVNREEGERYIKSIEEVLENSGLIYADARVRDKLDESLRKLGKI